MTERWRTCRVIAVVAVMLLAAACGDDGGTVAPVAPAAPVAPVEPVAPVANEIPELSEPTAALSAALVCPEARRHDTNPGVLLVPGTGLAAATAWAHMAAALSDDGYDVCTVDLVDTATGDIQRSAEYVVAAIRSMADEGYDQIAVVGFSQGALAARWALTWWPDTRESVVDLVSVAGPHGGSSTTAPLCGEGCAAALTQMTAGSQFLTALDAAWSDLDDVPPLTLVASETDTVVSVAEAGIAGTDTIVIQDVCPEHGADHVELLADPVAYAVVLDALGHDGPADPSRIDASACNGDRLGGDDWDPAAVTEAAFGVILGATPVAEEPALAAYAAG